MDYRCEEILNNEKVVNIFTGKNVALQLQLADCMKQKYFDSVLLQIPKKSSFLNIDILEALVNEAWNDGLNNFIIEIQKDKFDSSKASFATFFKTIFKNAYLNALSRELRKFEQTRKYLNDPSSMYKQQDKINTLEDKFVEAIKKMKEPCKSYFVFFYLEGMEYKQISIVTDRTRDSIKAQMVRCRNQFQKIIDHEISEN